MLRHLRAVGNLKVGEIMTLARRYGGPIPLKCEGFTGHSEVDG